MGERKPVRMADKGDHLVPLCQCLFNDVPADSSSCSKDRKTHLAFTFLVQYPSQTAVCSVDWIVAIPWPRGEPSAVGGFGDGGDE